MSFVPALCFSVKVRPTATTAKRRLAQPFRKTASSAGQELRNWATRTGRVKKTFVGEGICSDVDGLRSASSLAPVQPTTPARKLPAAAVTRRATTMPHLLAMRLWRTVLSVDAGKNPGKTETTLMASARNLMRFPPMCRSSDVFDLKETRSARQTRVGCAKNKNLSTPRIKSWRWWMTCART